MIQNKKKNQKVRKQEEEKKQTIVHGVSVLDSKRKGSSSGKKVHNFRKKKKKNNKHNCLLLGNARQPKNDISLLVCYFFCQIAPLNIYNNRTKKSKVKKDGRGKERRDNKRVWEKISQMLSFF